MKRSKLEILVLVLGALVIVSSLFIKFLADFGPGKELIITNIVFSVGFLIYIIYSMMTANSLNREVRKLNNHISSLKEEISKKDKQLGERKNRIDLLESEKEAAEQQLAENGEQIALLKEEITELRASQNEANP